MQDPKPGMSSKRDVIFHPCWGTVHELWPNGTTRCGSRVTIRVDDHLRVKADELPPKARSCERCRRIVQSD
jgi:hypothetical protein